MNKVRSAQSKNKIPGWFDVVDCKAVRNESKIESIISIFELYINEKSFKNTSIILKDKNVKSYTGSPITSQFLTRIINNKQVLGGDLYPGIVENSMFEKAQSILERNKKNTNRITSKVSQNILSEIAVCGVCGHKMTLQGSNKKGSKKSYKYLICSNKFYKKACDNINVNYPKIEAIILYINSVFELADTNKFNNNHLNSKEFEDYKRQKTGNDQADGILLTSIMINKDEYRKGLNLCLKSSIQMCKINKDHTIDILCGDNVISVNGLSGISNILINGDSHNIMVG